MLNSPRRVPCSRPRASHTCHTAPCPTRSVAQGQLGLAAPVPGARDARPDRPAERRRCARADGVAGTSGVAGGARARQLGAAHPRPARLAAGRRPPGHRAARLPRRPGVDGLPAQPPAPAGLPRPRLAPGPQPRRQPGTRRPARGPPARDPRPLRAPGEPGRLERRRHLRPRDGPRPARPHPLGHHPRQPVPRAPRVDPRLDDVPHHEPPPPGEDVHARRPSPSARLRSACPRRASTRAPTASSRGSAASPSRPRRPRTSRCTPPTSATGTSSRRCASSPTGSPSPRGGGCRTPGPRPPSPRRPVSQPPDARPHGRAV